MQASGARVESRNSPRGSRSTGSSSCIMKRACLWGRRCRASRDAATRPVMSPARDRARRSGNWPGARICGLWDADTSDALCGDRMTYSSAMAGHSMAGSRLPCQWRPERIALPIVHAMPDRPDPGAPAMERTSSDADRHHREPDLRGSHPQRVRLLRPWAFGCVRGLQSGFRPARLRRQAARRTRLANDTATQQCQIFNRHTAVLESLNVREEGTIRATYLCRNGAMADAAPAPHARMLRRQ